MLRLLEVILSGGLTGAFALGGVWLTQRGQRQDKEGDRRETRNDLLRRKAEEIYVEIEAVQARILKATMASAERYFVPGSKAGSLLDGEWLAGRLDHLKAHLHMYFRGAEPILKAWDDEILPMLAAHKKRIDALEESQPLEERLKALRHSEMVLAQETQTATLKALLEIRSFMNGKVKDLL